jgi:hypothetical protein
MSKYPKDYLEHPPMNEARTAGTTLLNAGYESKIHELQWRLGFSCLAEVESIIIREVERSKTLLLIEGTARQQ